MALEAEAVEHRGRHARPPARRGAACRARRRAPSGRGRARGRRRGRGPPAAPRRRSARPPSAMSIARPKPTRSPSRNAEKWWTTPESRIGSQRAISTRPAPVPLLVVDLPDLPVDLERRLVLGQRLDAAAPRRRRRAGGADAARHPGRAPAPRSGTSPSREQPLAGVGGGRRPAEPPLDRRAARAHAPPRAPRRPRASTSPSRTRCTAARCTSRRRRRIRRARSSRTSAAAGGTRRVLGQLGAGSVRRDRCSYAPFDHARRTP